MAKKIEILLNLKFKHGRNANMKSMYLFPITLFFLFLSATISAAPSITDSTTRINGSHKELTISGANFGPGPNVILFDTFSGGVAGEVIELDSPEIGQWSGRGGWEGKATYTKGANGNLGQGVRDFNYSTSSMNRMAQLDKDLEGNQTEIYFSYDVFVPTGNFFSGASKDYVMPTASSWKFTWLTDNAGVGVDDGYDMCIPTQVGSGNFTVAGNDGNVSWVSSGNDWAYHKRNRFSYWQKVITGNDGPFKYFIINEEQGMQKRESLSTRLMYSTNHFNNIRFPGWFGNGDQSNFNAVYDNIYIAVGANSQARVELSNSMTYDNSTFLQVFPPSSWSSSKIIVQLYGLEKPTDTLYIHITDANGNRSPGVKIGTASEPEDPPAAQVLH